MPGTAASLGASLAASPGCHPAAGVTRPTASVTPPAFGAPLPFGTVAAAGAHSKSTGSCGVKEAPTAAAAAPPPPPPAAAAAAAAAAPGRLWGAPAPPLLFQSSVYLPSNAGLPPGPIEGDWAYRCVALIDLRGGVGVGVGCGIGCRGRGGD